MDLLSKRYASPSFLLDGYISTGRFVFFLTGFIEQWHEDEQWEFFLHKVYDKSYDDFRAEVQQTQKLRSMTAIDIETTVQNSMSILGNFTPTTEGDEV